MSSRELSVLALIAAALLGACGDSESTTNQGGGGSAAGGGGGTAGSPTGGATTGGGGSGGGGGSAPACSLPNQGCGDGEKCSLVDEAAGIPNGLGCVAAGPEPAFHSCDADEACGPDLYCDYITRACKPFCGLPGLSCAAEENCRQGRNSAGFDIPGLFLCVADCSPFAAMENPCAGDPDATCYYRQDEAVFDCGTSGGGGWVSDCASGQDCSLGFACVGGMCLDWCSPVGGPNACFGSRPDGDFYCNNFTPCGPCEATGLEVGGEPIGSCGWGQ